MSLTAYADADHAGCQDTRRSTSGSAQFLGDKLVSCSQTMALPSIKFPCIVTIAVLLLYAAIMSSTPGPSTLTYDTISLESRKEKRSKIWSSYILYTMADVNVDALVEQAHAMAPPTRTDEQILPRSRWVPVGKRKCYLDVERSQSNPIYKISVDILKHTNFFRAFIASSTIPSIYIQQFWDTGYPKAVRTLSDVMMNDMFQPWRALTTIINLFLTGKTSWFERPRAPVLQILWGVGKKKATLIVIPSVRFTKLIIHHLQSKQKFHPRPGSPLHFPNEEHVLGYLKFSAKGTKKEVFGMPITNNLIIADIQGEQYYNAYLEKVVKHQRYLVGEEVSDPNSPAPKPVKATKPKATKQSKPLAPKAAPVTKPAAAKAPKTTASRPPKPTPATTEPSKKDQSKKRKLVKESSEAPSPAKRPKAGKVIKKRTQKSSRQLVDKFIDEGVLVNEPRFGDEEAGLQKAVEESLKDVHAAHQGPLPLVVIREPESGKFQPLLEVQGKGKEKVSEEQAAQVLVNLQTPKKKSHVDQYIFQRRSSAPTEPSGHDESSSLYAELGLTDSKTESDKEVPEIDAGDQDKGQAGPNPGIQDEGQARSNPGDATVSQP
ncbi:retrovirus-related pol polyprotein from transposon TNT 1-94 [Tanacetum coccineum]